MRELKLSREEKIGALLLLAGLVISLFVNLGLYPLYLEEPRRALISLEMMLSGNWIVPTEFGEFYYKKPPIWNWLQIVAFKVFGVNEFAARFFGVVSYLALGGAVYWSGRRFLNERIGTYAALLFLSTGSGLIYMNSAAGEIDLLYCAITFLMFVLIYHFYQKGQYFTLFLVAYFLTGLGALTKGIPSLVFVGMTLLGLFVERRRFWKLLGYKHIIGLALLAVMIGGYAYAYSQYNAFGLYFQTDDESLVEQSAGKSFLVSEGRTIIAHLFTFPFSMLFDLLPASMLILFALSRQTVAKWWHQPFLRYLIITFLLNILVYWLSPLTRTRYIYMLYPIPVMLLVYAYFESGKKWSKKVLDATIAGFWVLLGIGGVALPFIPSKELDLLSYLPGLSVAIVLMSGVGLWTYAKKPDLRLLTLIGAMVVLRVIFDFTASPVRALQSDMLNRKVEGQAIGELAHPHPVFIYKDSEINRQRIFYMEQKAENFVRLSDELRAGHFYFVDEAYVSDIGSHTVLYKVTSDPRKGIRTSYLIRINED